MRDIKYSDAIKHAETLIALGMTTLFLGVDDTIPWESATHCEPGVSFRNGIPVSATFQAREAGITFKWFFDLEHREANGSSLFKVNTEACRQVMRLLAPAARASFRDWLLTSASAVRAKGNEYQDAANNQFVIAASLTDLCTADMKA